MSKKTLVVDNIAFSKKNERIEGELSLQDLPRLEGLIQPSNLTSPVKVSCTGSITYVLQGKTDASGQYILELTVACSLTTVCQRCLAAMPLDMHLNFNYLICDVNDTDLEVTDLDNSDDYDLQQANKAMDLIELIEDEIIMAMPIAPMHEEGCTNVAMQSGEKPNPFAVLRGLIKS